LNPVEVTNKKKKSKNNQDRLKLFLDFFFFHSGALMDVAKQNPFVELKKNHTITFVKNQNQLFYNYFITFEKQINQFKF